MEFSLLYPKGVKPENHPLSAEAVNDLSVEYICEKLSGETYEQNIIRNIMINIERRPEVIRYRRDVFDDIFHFPKLRERIKELLDELAYLKELEKSVKDNTAEPIWQLINRLHELDVYVSCISGIYQSLSEHDIHSEGLLELKEFVGSVYNQNGFEYLHDDIKELVGEIGQVKSLSIGVNLDSRLRPVEVGIVSINNEPFTRPGLLSKFLDFSSKKNEISSGAGFHGMTKIHMAGKVAGDDPLMRNLSRTMTEMLGSTVRQLKNKLSKYTNVSGYGLTKMIPEFIFYIRWSDYLEKVRALSIPLCKPEISDSDKREMHTTGVYNFKLAIQNVSGTKFEIIRNDFEFTPEHGIYIMTGRIVAVKRLGHRQSVWCSFLVSADCMCRLKRVLSVLWTVSIHIFPQTKTRR